MVKALKGGSLEERVSRLQELLEKAKPEVRKQIQDSVDMLWIHHDGILEGRVYNKSELEGALSDKPVTDASLISAYDEIRNHKAAIDLVRDMADKKRLNLSLEMIKKLYVTLSPEDAEVKGPLPYRKELLHRLYVHDIVAPDKIAPRLKALIDWAAAAETKRTLHTVRLAAKVHHEFLLIYPFAKYSGNVARLLMNWILISKGYPPVIIHATERQRYYEAIKASPDVTAQLVSEALGASVESTILFVEKAGRAA